MAALSIAELKAFRATAAAFAKRQVKPMLALVPPDGELESIPELLREAEEAGLLATPRPEAAGYDAGIWGLRSLTEGPAVSLMLLAEVAEVCGGVAMCLHAAGLGSLLVAGAVDPPDPPRRAAAALMEGGFAPGWGVILDPAAAAPARIETTARAKDGGFELTGAKDFVAHAPGTEAFVVFGRIESEWGLFLAGADAPGLERRDAGHRLGLRATSVSHLVCNRAPAFRLRYDRPGAELTMEHLARLWLGQTAIALGIARGAMAEAWKYAAERYQGGTEIVNHPAMGGLLAEAEAGVMTGEGLLLAADRGDTRERLQRAAAAKLAGLEAAERAVTGCLQVFGGYGYMEDYGMEKRYRDVHTLRCAGGGPRELKLLLADLGRTR
jgi:alkylation response protein AidB-like acyl-CoA dehydrogenase